MKPLKTLEAWSLHRPPLVAASTAEALRLWSLIGVVRPTNQHVTIASQRLVTTALVKLDPGTEVAETRMAVYLLGTPDQAWLKEQQSRASCLVVAASAAAQNKEWGL